MNFPNTERIPWETNLSLLRSALENILISHNIVDGLDKILSDDAIINHWVIAFTHKSINQNNNYETIEFVGDTVIQYIMIKYIMQRFPGKLNEDIGSTFLNTYASEKYQIELSEKIGLDKLAFFDSRGMDYKTMMKIKEDVFESFIGCLNQVADKYLGMFIGTVYSYNFITALFNQVDIDLDNLEKDPKSRIKQIFDNLHWKVEYESVNADNLASGDMKTILKNQAGEVFGIGYGSKEESKTNAALDAIENLRKRGITEEDSRKHNRELKEKYSKLIDTLTLNIDKVLSSYNTNLKGNSQPIARYRVDMDKNNQSASIAIGYGTENNIQWKSNSFRVNKNDIEKYNTHLNKNEPLTLKYLTLFNFYQFLSRY